jgi:3-(3-hydroxy-phenyl)propionate hydroxylase
VRPDGDAVDVRLADGSTLRVEYLVGCDGGRSTVRKAAAIEFAGFDPSISFMIAEVEMTEDPEVGIRREGGGIGPVDPQQTGGPYRIVLKEQRVGHTAEPTLDDLRGALVAAYGTDYGAHDPTWISRFTDASRQATAYRVGRVLLAGDAAHIHYPHGGQGLNTGVQDAVNLGWKLAQVVHGTSPDSLLDTYHAERHPVAARVLQNTMAQVALTTPDDRHDALRATFAELLALDGPRTRIAAMLTGLDIHYELGGEHPLVGRRMPDLDLDTADGPLRTYELMHDGRALLVNLGEPAPVDVAPWAHRVRSIDAVHHGPWELPVIGAVAAPPAVLVRPDGHVAWVGSADDPTLPTALTAWCGPPGPPGPP